MSLLIIIWRYIHCTTLITVPFLWWSLICSWSAVSMWFVASKQVCFASKWACPRKTQRPTALIQKRGTQSVFFYILSVTINFFLQNRGTQMAQYLSWQFYSVSVTPWDFLPCKNKTLTTFLEMQTFKQTQ